LHTTTLNITPDQRAAIYRQVIQHLSGIGDVNLAYEGGQYDGAERLGDEYAQDLTLLADLGWAPDDPRESFELKMPADDLERALRRLHGDAESGLGNPEVRRAAAEDAEVRTGYERTAEVCSDLIAELSSRGERDGQ
jgi:hypothetical protein